MSEEVVRISPALLAYPDEDHVNLIIEVELPGVKKENIKVKMHECDHPYPQRLFRRWMIHTTHDSALQIQIIVALTSFVP